MSRCSVITPNRYVETAEYWIDGAKTGSVVKIFIRNKPYFGLVVKILDEKKIGYLKTGELTSFIIGEKYLQFIEDFARENITYKSYLVQYVTKQLSVRNFKFKPITIKEINIKLNDEQKIAVEKIMNNNKPFLLFGVTGSGKTEVFFQIIHNLLKEGGQTLILLPEIAITESICDRFFNTFGFMPEIWHSGAKKKSVFMKILCGEAKVVFGSRSAILLPFKNLKLVVIDEEHDTSYKQKSNPVYNCRDMAILRSKIENFKVILASATPSLETYYNVQAGNYEIAKLKKRYANRAMPDVTIKSADKLLSDYSKKRIQEELEKGGQVILFLNRRGVAPTVICQKCSERLVCSNCNSGLVLHKKCLMCHKCNKNFAIDECFNCKNTNCLSFYGMGVDRVAELVQKYFAQYKVEVFSSDHFKSREKIIDFMQRVKSKEIQIIIGTQMIAKGHDFPDISLIIVVNFSDLGYDFRSSELLFQNLIQITGRAGRGDKNSEVIVQTYDRQNSLLQSLQDNNYEMFLESEVEGRKTWKLPPFFKLILIKIMHSNNQKAFSTAEKIQDLLQPISEEVYDPLCVGVVRKQYYYHIFCKMSIENFYKNLDDLNTKLKGENVLVDIDPYDLMSAE